MLKGLKLSTVPSLEQLKKWNIWLAVIYGLQAVAILLLGSSQLAPLTTSFLTIDSLLTTTTGKLVLAPATHRVFDLNLLYATFAVMVVLAMVHASQATWYRSKYEGQLGQNHNDGRWAMYGVSASLTFMVLAILAGLTDIAMILVLLILGVILHTLCAWVERTVGQRGRTRVGTTFGYGLLVLAGLAMWLVVVVYLLGDNIYGGGHIPARVYWLAVTAAITSGMFAVGLARQIQKPQTGSRYRLTEKSYMILTFVTSTLLVWEIVAGTMQ